MKADTRREDLQDKEAWQCGRRLHAHTPGPDAPRNLCLCVYPKLSCNIDRKVCRTRWSEILLSPANQTDNMWRRQTFGTASVLKSLHQIWQQSPLLMTDPNFDGYNRISHIAYCGLVLRNLMLEERFLRFQHYQWFLSIGSHLDFTIAKLPIVQVV